MCLGAMQEWQHLGNGAPGVKQNLTKSDGVGGREWQDGSDTINERVLLGFWENHGLD